MIDKEILLEMIKEQENVVQKAKEQLNKLHSLASQMGISVVGRGSSIKNEIEEKRRELMEKMEKIKGDALAHAAQVAQVKNVSIPHYGNDIIKNINNFSLKERGAK